MAFIETLCKHRSTVHPETWIVLDRIFEYHIVTVRTEGTIVYRESWNRETRGRERFEKVVASHEKGEVL